MLNGRRKTSVLGLLFGCILSGAISAMQTLTPQTPVQEPAGVLW